MLTAPIYFLLLLSSLISKVDDYQLVASVCRLYWSCIKVWDVYCEQQNHTGYWCLMVILLNDISLMDWKLVSFYMELGD